jgi:putative ABC transport system permease protein
MLFRKMLRDMGNHKTQFLSIFIMAFLGVYIYAGIGGEWIGLRSNSDAYYRETNFADVWVYGKNFSAQDETAVKKLGGVTGAERSLILDGAADLSGKPKLSLHFLEKDTITKSHLVKGEGFRDDADGIWVDDRFASAHRLKPGDKIAVSVNGIRLEKKIVGTVYNPEYVYLAAGSGITPDFSSYGYAYLSKDAFPVPEKLAYNEMMFTVADGVNASGLESAVGKAVNGNVSVYLTRENQPSYSMFAQEIDQHKAMGSIFPVAFLAIALLTMLTTMTRIVNAQRIQIGTLKAVGFKNRTILLHYVSYGFWLSLAGSLLGAVLGPVTLPKLFYPSMSSFYTLPEWGPAFDVSFYLMAAATVALCTLVTWLACRSVLKDTPAKTLRPKAPKNVRHGFLEKTALWKKLNFNAQWNLRDIARNRVRSLMAVVGVLGCTALLMCAFGMNSSMRDLKAWQYEQIDSFASQISVSDAATDAQIQNARNKTDGQAVMESTIEIKAKGEKKSANLMATDRVTLIRATDVGRNIVSLPENGVSLTSKLADELGVKQGDEITWHLYGDEKWTKTPVAQIYRDPTVQGIRMTRTHFESLGYRFRATSIVTPREVTQKFAGMNDIQSTADLTAGWDSMTASMMKMVYILIAAAAVMAVVVLYNLGLLSFTEMERELATLKVIGLKSGKLRGLLLTQNLWLSAVGFLLGIPAGQWLIGLIMSMSGDSFDMINELKATNLLLAFVVTFALSVFVNLLFSNRIRHLDMVASLKGVE